MMPCGLL